MDSSRNDTERVARFVAKTSIENIPNDVWLPPKPLSWIAWGLR